MITFVYGTRPDAIKLGPIVAELRLLEVPLQIVSTGQHTDLLRGTPAETDLRDSLSLNLKSDGNVMRWVHAAQRPLQEALLAADIVVVQGDTMSAYAAAQAATKLEKVLVHVEAGVRSHYLDEPWPEERFRIQIDEHADWHYAATPHAFANLLAEGHEIQRIRVTGNSVVSALARYAGAQPCDPADHCLVTLHRREWMDGPHFVTVLDALFEAARDHAAARFIWPMHPTVAKRLSQNWVKSAPPNFLLMSPLPYREAAGLLAHAFGVLTDSGGLVEEAATLGVPSVQLRNVSDRPEAIDAGVSRLETPTPEGVHRAMEALTTGIMPRRPSPVFGDVTAAAQIARALAQLDPTC